MKNQFFKKLKLRRLRMFFFFFFRKKGVNIFEFIKKKKHTILIEKSCFEGAMKISRHPGEI